MLDIPILTAIVAAIAALITAIVAIIQVVFQGKQLALQDKTIKEQGRNLDRLLESHEKSRKEMDEVDHRMQQKFDQWILETNRKVDECILGMIKQLQRDHEADTEEWLQRQREERSQDVDEAMKKLAELFGGPQEVARSQQALPALQKQLEEQHVRVFQGGQELDLFHRQALIGDISAVMARTRGEPAALADYLLQCGLRVFLGDVELDQHTAARFLFNFVLQEAGHQH